MKTFVINLPRSTERRERMGRMLAAYPELEVEFIDAVDGCALTDEEREERFDTRMGDFRTLGRMRPGEIGCTLSHQKCYHRIVDERIPCALILEDDLKEGADFGAAVRLLEPLLDTPAPRAILLSGRFWWMTARQIDRTHRLARVFDAFLTHAYMINLAGARVLVDDRPGYIADNWRYLIRRGLHLYGVVPHFADQDHEMFASLIQGHRRDRNFGSWWWRLWARIRREPFKRLRKRMLEKAGRLEP
jgi:glycosyl transferase family 25